MALDTAAVRECLATGDLHLLFREHLGWDNFKGSLAAKVEGEPYELSGLAEKCGFQVFECSSAPAGRIPPSLVRRAITTKVGQSAHESFVVFANSSRSEMLWQAPVSSIAGFSTSSRRCFVNAVGEGTMQLIRHLNVWDEDSTALALPAVAAHVAQAFRDDATQFYRDHFAELDHASAVAGLEPEPDRRSEFYDPNFLQFQQDYVLHSIPSPAEHKALGIRVKHGDEREREGAIQEFVLRNQRLVLSVATKYRNRGLDLLDLMQEGSIGLTRASELFDYTLGNQFSTYATPWIRQAITRAIPDQGTLVRLPVHMHEQVARLRQCERGWLSANGELPTDAELLELWRHKFPLHEVTLDKLVAIRVAAAVSEPLPLPDYDSEDPLDDDLDRSPLVHDGPADPSPGLFEAAVAAELKLAVAHVLKTLTAREQRVIHLRFGLDDGRSRTLEEVGREFGVTRERIRQIEAKALRKMKHPSRRRHLEGFLGDTPQLPIRFDPCEEPARAGPIVYSRHGLLGQWFTSRWGAVFCEIRLADETPPDEDEMERLRDLTERGKAWAEAQLAPDPAVNFGLFDDDDFIIAEPATPHAHQRPLDLPGSLPLFEQEPRQPLQPVAPAPPSSPSQLLFVELAPGPVLRNGALSKEESLDAVVAAFRSEGYTVVDNRDKNGALWIYDATMALANRIQGLRSIGLKFTYAEHSRAGRWGWWMK